eukprot:PhM_4_TR1443/c0_g1_i1/m.63227
MRVPDAVLRRVGGYDGAAAGPRHLPEVRLHQRVPRCVDDVAVQGALELVPRDCLTYNVDAVLEHRQVHDVELKERTHRLEHERDHVNNVDALRDAGDELDGGLAHEAVRVDHEWRDALRDFNNGWCRQDAELAQRGHPVNSFAHNQRFVIRQTVILHDDEQHALLEVLQTHERHQLAQLLEETLAQHRGTRHERQQNGHQVLVREVPSEGGCQCCHIRQHGLGNSNLVVGHELVRVVPHDCAEVVQLGVVGAPLRDGRLPRVALLEKAAGGQSDLREHLGVCDLDKRGAIAAELEEFGENVLLIQL